jgi:hypothetical protein
VTDFLRSHLLWRGGIRKKGVDFLIGQQPDRVRRVTFDDPVDILAGIQAHVRQHAGEKSVLAGSQLAHRNPLSLQISNCPDSLGSDELEAPAVEAGQDDKRGSPVDREDQVARERRAEIGLTGGQRFRLRAFDQLDVSKIAEPLAAQELLGHVLRCVTERGVLGVVDQADRRGLGGRLGFRRFGSESHEPSGSRERQPAYEIPSGTAVGPLGLHGNV